MNDNHPGRLPTQDLDINIVEQHLETLKQRQHHGPDPEREQAIRELRTILNHAVHNPETAPGWGRTAPLARLALEQLAQHGDITPRTWWLLGMLKYSHTGTLGTESARRIRATTPPMMINAILTLSADGADHDTAQQVKDLADRGEVEALGQRADTGDRDAALQLARVLADRGDAEQLTVRAAAGDQFASLQLARLLADRGDTDALSSRAAAGDDNAAGQLAKLLAQRGDTDALTARADAGDTDAAAQLARLLAERGDLNVLSSRAAAGDQFAAGRLGRSRIHAGPHGVNASRPARNAATVLLPVDHADVEERDVAGKFEVYEDRSGKYRFRLKASNGQIVATGEAYETKAAARKGCESVQRAAEGAPVVETEA